MNSDRLQKSVADLRRLARVSRLLPPGVVASVLDVSKQRVSDLCSRGVILTEPVLGSRLVVVSSALRFAELRCHRIRK